jgi:hypothetical protein
MIAPARALIAAAAVGLAIVLVGAPDAFAQQAQPVPIQVEVRPDGAQLIFIWPDSVDYDATIVERKLEVRFGRPLRPRFSQVLTKLPNLVESAGVADGGRVVTLHLNGDYTLTDRREGNGVVIVLAAANGEAIAVTDTAPNDLAALPAPLVAMRFGSHEDFSRAVFDWNREVGYRVERDGDRVVLRFDTRARIAPVSIDDLPPHITAINPVSSDGGLAVAFDVAPGAEHREYRSGLKVVFDVLAPEGGTPGPIEPEAPADTEIADWQDPAAGSEKETAYIADVVEPDVSDETAEETEVAAVAEAESESEDGVGERDSPPGAPLYTPTDRPARTADEAPAEASTMPEPEPAGARPATAWAAAGAGETTAKPVVAARQVELQDPAGETEDEETVANVVVPDPDPGPEADPAPDPAPGPEAASAPDPGPEPAEIEVTDQGPTILVGFDKIENGLDLEFPWPDAVGAAIFRRAGHLWVLFDSPAQFSFRLLAENMPVIAEAEQMAVPGRALARFKLSGQYKPRVRVEDNTWIVSLGASGGPAELVDVVGRVSADIGAHLMVLDESAGAELVIVDPDVGDQLFIVPLATVGSGVAPARRLVDLEMIETAQGIVVRPIADTVAVRSLPDGVEITNLAGLNIGGVADANAEGDDPGFLTPPAAMTVPALPVNDGTGLQLGEDDFLTDDERLFDFVSWKGDPDDEYLKSKHAFNIALGNSDDEQRGDARLDLARFHFASGQAAEALGWIDRALLDAPWLDQDMGIRALRGAANLLLGRFGEAHSDLFDPLLDFHREMRLWRGAYHAENGDMGAADRAFTVARDVPEDYPRHLSRRFRLMAAEAAARAGNVARAQTLLDDIAAENLRQIEMDRLDYARALAYEAAGKVSTALDLYQRAEASNDRYVRAIAGRDRLELQLANGDISRADVIEGFDRLRFIWRGDQFELDLMQRMAEMYIEDGKYGNGLSSYREVISVFPDSPDVRVIANVMNDTYKDLFLGEEAEKLTPVEALALYYDFRELTPVGAVGDQMIFHLADRLIEVDLLPEAAEVLQHQVDFRLRGNELATVGARLAEVYLLDQLPKHAVHALRASAVPGMPAELAEARERLMVQALTETEEYQPALDLMRGDTSARADRMRALIFWRQKDWLSAATVTARLFENWEPGEALSKEEGEDIMRLAVALALTNNRSALAELREEHGELIAASEQARAFEAIASYIDAGPIDPNALSEAAEEIDSYEAFLGALREKVENDKLAAVE